MMLDSSIDVDRFTFGGVRGILISKNCECHCHCSPYGSICEKEALDADQAIPECCRDYEKEHKEHEKKS